MLTGKNDTGEHGSRLQHHWLTIPCCRNRARQPLSPVLDNRRPALHSLKHEAARRSWVLCRWGSTEEKAGYLYSVLPPKLPNQIHSSISREAEKGLATLPRGEGDHSSCPLTRMYMSVISPLILQIKF